MTAGSPAPGPGPRPGAGAPRDLLVVAGEASGDLHGARLLTELRRLRPEVAAFGLGGDELARAGLEPLGHSREVAVVGITEALAVLPRARRLFRRLLAEVDRRAVRTAVLIDFPEFNLRLARRLRQRGVRVVYYVSPQIWAWRQGRVRAIARRVDRMLVLFPFEVDFYAGHGVAVTHVGHPLVDEVPALPQAWEVGEPAGDAFRIALLPGSRPQEVAALLPVMLEAARRLAERFPRARFQLIQAPTIDGKRLARDLEGFPLAIERVEGDRFAAIAASHLALCASGTATLEVGLLGTPLIVTYRVGAVTYRFARWLVRTPYVSLVNLVLGRPAVPELLQQAANPERMAAVAADILTQPGRAAAICADLAELRGRLGRPGASRRAAAQVEQAMRAGETPA